MVEYPQDTTNRITIGAITHNQKIQSINKHIYRGYSKRLWWESNPQQLEGIELNNDMLSLLYS